MAFMLLYGVKQFASILFPLEDFDNFTHINLESCHQCIAGNVRKLQLFTLIESE